MFWIFCKGYELQASILNMNKFHAIMNFQVLLFNTNDFAQLATRNLV